MLLTMLVIQCSLNVIYSGIWHSTAFKKLKPLLRGFCLCNVLNHAIELESVFDPVTVFHEAGVRFPLRVSQPVTKNAEQSIVTTTKENVTVESLVTSIRDDRC